MLDPRTQSLQGPAGVQPGVASPSPIGPQGLVPQQAAQAGLPGIAVPPGPAPVESVPAAQPVPGGALSPQEQAMQAAAMQADEMFAAQFGESFLAKMQAGQVSPEEEQIFTQILEQVLGGTTTGQQEFANTNPAGII